MISTSYDVINPEVGLDPINALLQVANSGETTELTLRPADGGDPFTIPVSEVIVRHDKTGVFMADAVTPLGKVSCRIFKETSPGMLVGRVTVATEGDPE